MLNHQTAYWKSLSNILKWESIYSMFNHQTAYWKSLSNILKWESIYSMFNHQTAYWKSLSNILKCERITIVCGTESKPSRVFRWCQCTQTIKWYTECLFCTRSKTYNSEDYIQCWSMHAVCNSKTSASCWFQSSINTNASYLGFDGW